MNAENAISYIESFAWSETRLGLERTRELLDKIGNPQNRLKFVHVAGTNGKGSICAMLSSILQAAGYKTGLYTSPYILKFNERIQINGEMISDEKLEEETLCVKQIAEQMHDHPSQFELVTAIAMQYFLHEECDIVVLEVGLGGALDSTNVINKPEVAVITNIGLEHTEYLGNTLTKIAEAKAGIIKDGCTAVCYRTANEVENVFEQVCMDRGAKLIKADFDSITPISYGLNGQHFSWREMDDLYITLLGEHQLYNAAVALEAILQLQKNGWRISSQSIRRGLANTAWPARFELLNTNPIFIVDGAHNPQCAEALSNAIAQYLPKQKITFIIGVLEDKDYVSVIKSVASCAREFICVTPNSPRAMQAEKLAEYLKYSGLRAEAAGSIDEGIELSLQISGSAPIVAFGSLYMAGVVREKAKNIFKKCVQ